VLATPVNQGEAVYYCSQDIVGPATCYRSDTLGASYGPSVLAYNGQGSGFPGGTCGGLHGHIHVAPNGTAWLPVDQCSGLQGGVFSTDGGTTWSTPTQVNGSKTAAAFSPTVRYLPGSVLAITYYDLRDYVAGSSVLSTSAWLSESNDGGTTWHELRLQSPFDLNKAPPADSGFGTALFLGDNQGLALVGSNPLPLYAATSSAGGHVDATQSPSPLTSSTAHVYAASLLGPIPAAAAARAQANIERMRTRAIRGRP